MTYNSCSKCICDPMHNNMLKGIMQLP